MLRKLVLLSIFLFVACPPASAKIVLHDLEDRTVTLEAPAKRLLIDDGRMIFALSFMDENPASLIAAWPHDIDRLGRLPYAALASQFPEINALPDTGSNANGMSAEAILSVDPDLVVLSAYSHMENAQLRLLEAAGVPVIFVDFVANPLENADRSLLLLGKATGHESKAEKLIAFRKDHREAIGRRLSEAGATDRPSMFLEAHASATGACCFSPGRGGIGTLIAFAGADNVGDALGDKPFGQLSIEAIFADDPDIYIASGGAYMKARAGLLIGPEFSGAEEQQSLDRLLSRPGFRGLKAIAKGRVYGIDKHLFDPVVDIIALELLAKWVNPELFSDLDVDATRKTLDAMTPVGVAPGYWLEAEE